MGIFGSLFGGGSKASAPQASVPPSLPYSDSAVFFDINDPAFREYLKYGCGLETDSGVAVTADKAMRNASVFRCVSLISRSIGMLPLHLKYKETKQKASEHSLYRLLHRRPNNWQTAYDFRTLMQRRALVDGDAYALIVRSRDFRTGTDTVVALNPLAPNLVTPVQNPDWSVSYRYQPPNGGTTILSPSDVLHIRDMSRDGIRGTSLVRQAADVIGLALAAELALARLYKQGSFVNGYLTHPKLLSGEAAQRLKDQWNQRYSGAANAGSTPVLEEGLEYKSIGASAKDAQSQEIRKQQFEEFARIFGVPRPLMMIDESWGGSGIDSLGQLFVDYGLCPWFEAWQQAIERSLLTDEEADQLEVKFNAGALLRGSMKDQGQFFAWALGQGGGRAFLDPDEVRDIIDLPPMADGAGGPAPQQSGGNANA